MKRRGRRAETMGMSAPWLPASLRPSVAAGADVQFFDAQGQSLPVPIELPAAEHAGLRWDGDLASVYAPDRPEIVRVYKAALADSGAVHGTFIRARPGNSWVRFRVSFVSRLDDPALGAVVRVVERFDELPEFVATERSGPAEHDVPWVRLRCDAAARITGVEGRARDLYGLTADELIGRSSLDFVHPEDMPQTSEAGLRAISGEGQGEDVTWMHRIVRPDGTTVQVFATIEVTGATLDDWHVKVREAGRAISQDLTAGLERGELFLVYQPVVEVGTARMLGAEALVRWIHPVEGFIPPDRFIPLAEMSEIIIELGAWVLRTACAEAATWPAHLDVAVNLSVRQLVDRGIVDTVARALADAGLSADRLVLEVTESALMENTDLAVEHLRLLKELGVRIAIDDFGTGYSSLLYLKRMPVDILKVDRCFVAGLGEDKGDTAIVESVIFLARALDLKVVAEGVETEAQHRYLASLGCETAQGFLWSRPAPADQFQTLIDRPLAVSE
jgi:PAS domain S-box-containing protein